MVLSAVLLLSGVPVLSQTLTEMARVVLVAFAVGSSLELEYFIDLRAVSQSAVDAAVVGVRVNTPVTVS